MQPKRIKEEQRRVQQHQSPLIIQQTPSTSLAPKALRTNKKNAE